LKRAATALLCGAAASLSAQIPSVTFTGPTVACRGQRIDSVIVDAQAPTVIGLRRVPVVGNVVRNAHVITRHNIIRGYMLPLDPLGTQYVLSKHPMANCFFCGKAGPETVLELRLHPKSIRRYTMDEVHTFKGILRLNEKNPATLHYIIESAERM